MFDSSEDTFFLTVLLCSVVVGFASTLLILRSCDSRVFDANGRLLPSPINHLWGHNLITLLQDAWKIKQPSQAMFDFLLRVGDGNIVAVNVFGQKYVIIAHPEMVKVVLSGHHLKFPKVERNNRLKFVYGEGLMTSGGGRWQAHRHMLNSGFHAASLKQMLTVFNNHAAKCLDNWCYKTKIDTKIYDAAIGTAKIDLCYEINKLILCIMCESALGVEVRRDVDLNQITADVATILTEADTRLHYDMYDTWSKLNPRRVDKVAAAINRMDSLVDNVIAERIEYYASEIEKTEDVPHLDLLDILLTTSTKREGTNGTSNGNTRSNSNSSSANNSGSNTPTGCRSRANSVGSIDSSGSYYESRMSSTALRDHLMTMFLAGHETMSATIMWIIYELCMHPEIQSKCQEEVDTLLFVKPPSMINPINNYNGYSAHSPYTSAPNSTKSNGGGSNCFDFEDTGDSSPQYDTQYKDIDYRDIYRFDYLMSVIKETLRLHPTIPTIARQCTQECQLGGYKLQPHFTILINAIALHRHPDFWTHPNTFNPDRFAKTEIDNTLKKPLGVFQYVPFSTGVRNCIGQRFAQMSMVVVLANLISSFQFSLTSDGADRVRFEETTTLHPVDFMVQIKRRGNKERAHVNGNIV